MVTIKDIAKLANVSRSTVSRVLNNSGYVSEDARKRVEEVIEETGYVPSEQAKSLRTKKTKVIGVILPTIQTETPSRIVTGVGKELAKHGYQILLANTNLDKDKEFEYLDLLKVRQVDGIILIATNTEPELMEKIKAINIPFVMIGQESEEVMYVSYDDYQAARDLTSFLIDEGHEKIGFIGVDETDRAVGHERKRGYLDEMESRKLPVEKEWMQQGIFDIDSGREAMKRMIESIGERPTAVLAVTDRLAIGAMSYLKQQGMSIPDEMAVAGFGASEMSQYIDPPLTTVDYQNEQAGIEAAKQIMASIRSQNVQEKVILDGRLIIRNSV
ncbi:LacI family DNA-binding transcriptional regulator [Virgibacillus xinjiangensis]|uniref:LacI family DNA-binding transcriptional regulator n=1 Tax=Virgibacillus xinjiangensis TaxID=393090 RepID=A0ABV7CWN8_9BACI